MACHATRGVPRTLLKPAGIARASARTETARLLPLTLQQGARDPATCMLCMVCF